MSRIKNVCIKNVTVPSPCLNSRIFTPQAISRIFVHKNLATFFYIYYAHLRISIFRLTRNFFQLFNGSTVHFSKSANVIIFMLSHFLEPIWCFHLCYHFWCFIFCYYFRPFIFIENVTHSIITEIGSLLILILRSTVVEPGFF